MKGHELTEAVHPVFTKDVGCLLPIQNEAMSQQLSHKIPPASLKGESIVSFALDRWNYIWRNRHHVISQLASENSVLFVSPPIHIREVVQDVLHVNRTPTGLYNIAPNLHGYVPPRWLPFSYRYPNLERRLEEMRIRDIRKQMHRLGMERPILYIWHPMFVNMVDRFDERLVIYHCYDELTAFSDCVGTERELLMEQEKQLLRKADIVFTSSKDLAKRKGLFNPNTHVVRNAVDYTLFAAARKTETKIPEDLHAIPSPIVGCVAATGNYIDVKLLYQVFAQRPNWSFVFIGVTGDADEHWKAFKKLPNVYFLGRRNLDDLPGYLKAFDVCVMPYVMTDKVLVADSPLKMYEYLATGKPIVSVPLPSISQLKPVITFAEGVDEWIAAIQRALEENSHEVVEQRQAIARQNTWHHRAALISELITRELERISR